MQRASYFSVRPFAWHAVAATLAVIVLPLVVVGALLLADVRFATVVIALLGVGLAIGATAIGAAWWNKRVESAEISFSDLMVWRWFMRRRAEETLEEGARLLGLDRSGHPVDDVRITPEQQLEVLKDLTAALESKDPYTHGHSQRVERHAYRTAAAMHLSVHDIEDLRKAAALHDVGKIRVPDRILRKPERLTDDERAVMEEHSVVGAWMVSSVGNADVIAAVRHHHERWDGAGYPDGLAHSDIPLFSRIIAVSDAYDAITSTRPYRSSMGRDDAVACLREGSGTQFDPEVVEAFIAALPARLPVTAGLFLILGGAPQRLLRALASWMKRLGAGSLSPAVGAAGAAVVLGASIFTPSIPAPAQAEPPAAAPAQSEGLAPDVDPLPRRVRKDRPSEAGDEVAGKRYHRRIDGSIVLSDEMTRDGGEPEGKGAADEPVQDETPQPEPGDAPEKTNPNDGRDACTDGNAGEGNDPERCGTARENGREKPREVVNAVVEEAKSKADPEPKDKPKNKKRKPKH